MYYYEEISLICSIIFVLSNKHLTVNFLRKREEKTQKYKQSAIHMSLCKKATYPPAAPTDASTNARL